MQITLKDFQQLSTRTAPQQADPQNHIEKQYLLTNYTLGLNGEFIEWRLAETKEERIKEAGDVLHYAAVLLKVLGKTVTDESAGLKIVPEKLVSAALGETLEIIKKTYYHGHEFKEKEFIKAVKTVVDYIYDELGKDDFYLAMYLNIEKLKKRYPEGFNSEDSIKRVDTK